MIRALIFDFDGLILDTELPVFQSWQEIYQEFDCKLSLSTWSVCIGTASSSFDPYQNLQDQLSASIDREDIQAKLRLRNQELIQGQHTLPGVEGYLQDARRLNLKIGLASSSPRNWVIPHLARLDLLHYFDDIKTRDDVTETKPHPALYTLALGTLAVAADEAIVLEDSPNGIRAAKSAGIFCVSVPNSITKHLSIEEADLQLSSLADLPLHDLIAQVESLTVP